MGTPYVGEIRMFAGNFPPNGWMFCDGSVLPISENEVLFQLIGTTYGGDGQSTFALPNLQGRVPVHPGSGGGGSYVQAQTGGAETVTLTVQQIPVHTHPVLVANAGGVASPSNALLATATSTATGLQVFNAQAPGVSLHASSVTATGGSQPHENMQPFLCINYIISLFGIFPSQT